MQQATCSTSYPLARAPMRPASRSTTQLQPCGMATATQLRAAAPTHPAPFLHPLPPMRLHARAHASYSSASALLPAPRLSPFPARRGHGAATACNGLSNGRGSSGNGPEPSYNPVELVKREVDLQSNRLQPEVRERVEDAIDLFGRRVTVGDVASRAGVKLSEADEALKALAYDTQATLQVSNEGDVVYVFSPGFRSTLRNKSLLQRTRPLFQKLASAGAYLVRVAFGTALISSVVLVWLALLAILSGRGSSNDDRRSGGYGGGGYGHHSMRMFMDAADLFLYWDPYYYRTSAQRVASGEPLSFVESIFSFVFGDGDPNMTYEERRWKQLGQMIRSKGGVVTAEEMAPFLEPPEPNTTPGEPTFPDEAFVLPALIKFGGEPIVDEQGDLLYKFPSLQRSGVQARGRGGLRQEDTYDVPLEAEWDFTAASTGQVFGTILLGVLNVVGVGMLSGLMGDPSSRYLLAAQGLGFIMGLMPFLQVYAAAFFAIPGFRWLANTQRNQQISGRNEARVSAAELLNSGSGRRLQAKLQAARTLGKEGVRVVDQRDVVFTTDKDVTEQVAKQEVDDWDSRLNRR